MLLKTCLERHKARRARRACGRLRASHGPHPACVPVRRPLPAGAEALVGPASGCAERRSSSEKRPPCFRVRGGALELGDVRATLHGMRRTVRRGRDESLAGGEARAPLQEVRRGARARRVPRFGGAASCSWAEKRGASRWRRWRAHSENRWMGNALGAEASVRMSGSDLLVVRASGESCAGESAYGAKRGSPEPLLRRAGAGELGCRRGGGHGSRAGARMPCGRAKRQVRRDMS